jgi:dTDP-4-amino-4,6-dideoxygalactose transaminase
MGEIEAAIASKQLLKLDDRIASRQRVAAELSDGLQSLRGVQTPHVADGASHVYYVYGLTLNIQELGVSRNQIVAALHAEGVPYLMSGYQNIHLLPLFRKKIAYGIQGFPWTSDYCSSKQVYAVGLCPIAEELHTHSFLGLNICMNELPSSDVALIIEAFHKVWSNLDNLKASD